MMHKRWQKALYKEMAPPLFDRCCGSFGFYIPTPGRQCKHSFVCVVSVLWRNGVMGDNRRIYSPFVTCS